MDDCRRLHIGLIIFGNLPGSFGLSQEFRRNCTADLAMNIALGDVYMEQSPGDEDALTVAIIAGTRYVVAERVFENIDDTVSTGEVV